jgi:drug/metabolite transporter (DMT)-like permease
VLSRTDIASTGAMVVFSNLVAVVVFAPFFTTGWVMPADGLGLGVLALLGVLGTVGHLFATRAYSIAPAPIIAPFSYSQLLWMALIGYVVFNDVPSLNTGIGAGIVVASGLYLLYRETSGRPEAR